MFYIYPLKFLFTLLINYLLLNHALGFNVFVNVEGFDSSDMPTLMMIYGMGFLLVFLILVLMHVHAYRQRLMLDLNDLEIFDTRSAIGSYGICVVASVISILIVAIGPKNHYVYPMLAGWVYALIGPAQAVYGMQMNKKRVSLISE